MPHYYTSTSSIIESSIDKKLRKVAIDKTRKTDMPGDDEQNSCRKRNQASSSFDSPHNHFLSPVSSEAGFIVIETQEV